MCIQSVTIHPFIHSFTGLSIHSLIYPFIHSVIHSFTFHSFTHSFIHSVTIYPFIHSFTDSSIHSVIHPFTFHSFTHSFTDLSIHSLSHPFIRSPAHSTRNIYSVIPNQILEGRKPLEKYVVGFDSLFFGGCWAPTKRKCKWVGGVKACHNFSVYPKGLLA